MAIVIAILDVLKIAGVVCGDVECIPHCPKPCLTAQSLAHVSVRPLDERKPAGGCSGLIKHHSHS